MNKAQRHSFYKQAYKALLKYEGGICGNLRMAGMNCNYAKEVHLFRYEDSDPYSYWVRHQYIGKKNRILRALEVDELIQLRLCILEFCIEMTKS